MNNLDRTIEKLYTGVRHQIDSVRSSLILLAFYCLPARAKQDKVQFTIGSYLLCKA